MKFPMQEVHIRQLNIVRTLGKNILTDYSTYDVVCHNLDSHDALGSHIVEINLGCLYKASTVPFRILLHFHFEAYISSFLMKLWPF